MSSLQKIQLVTPEQVGRYFREYKKSLPEGNLLELFAKALGSLDFQRTRLEMFRVTVQVHLLGVPVKNVDSDIRRLHPLFDAIAPHLPEIEKVYEERTLPEMTTLEASAIAVNTLITFWNENPDKFVGV